MPSKAKAATMKLMLLNSGIPFEHRRQMLLDLCIHESDEARAVVAAILEAAAASSAESIFNEKVKALDALMAELKAGPLRNATYFRMLGAGAPALRALVRLEDGTSAAPVVPDPELAAALHRGSRVMLDAQARCVLFADPVPETTGEEARFERRIGRDCVEVTLRGDERLVIYASQPLADRLDKEEVAPGAWLLISARQGIAWDALPVQDTLGHYQYLDRSRVPDVHAARDIGSPPAYLFELAEAVRTEMTDPACRRLFRLRRCQMRLLSGRSGTGKTLSVYALWRLLYETMSEVTGVPVEDLPPRVVRVRAAQVLSMWFSESERNLDRCFREVLQLADESFVAPDGKAHTLPVLVIIEEIDGLGRARGAEAVYDRVMTTLLQLLDPTRQELKDRLIVFVATTNVESLVDTALLRRVGATVEHFGTLDRRAFAAVLTKHLDGMPIVARNGAKSPAECLRSVVQELTTWLYSPNGEDRGQVELMFANAAAPVTRYRRDFLTGGLVDRAVQQAADAASRAARRGETPVGLTADLLMTCFDEQVQSTAERLDIYNAASYLDLPDGQRLTAVRRVARDRGPLPVALMRPRRLDARAGSATA